MTETQVALWEIMVKSWCWMFQKSLVTDQLDCCGRDKNLEKVGEEGGVQGQKSGWKALGAHWQERDWQEVDQDGGHSECVCGEGSTKLQPGGLGSVTLELIN